MMDLKSVKVKQAAEKVIGREGQSPFDEMFKQDNFPRILSRKRIGISRTPLNKFLSLKKAPCNKTQQIIVGALTWAPFATSAGLGSSFIPLPLGRWFLACRSLCRELLPSHELGSWEVTTVEAARGFGEYLLAADTGKI